MLAVAAVVIIINAIIFLNVLTGFKLFAYHWTTQHTEQASG